MKSGPKQKCGNEKSLLDNMAPANIQYLQINITFISASTSSVI